VRRLALFVVALGVMFIVSVPGMAQTAAINGTITDPSGAVVEQAQVTATNTATGLTRTITTGDKGVYNLTQLVPGVYEVRIEKNGFRTVKFSGLVLTVDQALTFNAKLDVGSTSEQVTVEGTSVAPIDTTDAQVSNVIDAQQMQELPLILRDPYQLVLLTPGTTYTNTGTGGFSINGGRDRNNNFQLDGTTNNDPGVPGSGLATLNPDATEEFRVITNDYLPEFGRNSSAVIDIISRSGTNHLHGDTYYFGRWNALGARDFFNPASQGRQSPYVRNTFGASVGGPIKKDKAFFFFNYEGNRFSTSTVTTASIPDPGFSTGKFTYIDPQAGPIPIDVSAPNSFNNGVGLSLDPQVQKLLSFYPAKPNGPAVVPGVSNDFFFADPDLSNTNNYLAKVDYALTPKNNLSVRYLANQGTDNGANLNTLPGIGGVASSGVSHSVSGHLTTTLTPTHQNDFFASAFRSNPTFTCNGVATIDGLSLAGTDAFGRGRDWFALPGSPFAAIACLGLGDSNGQQRRFGIYTIGDNFTWIKGRHTLKFGFEFDDSYENNFNSFSTRSTPGFAINLNQGASALTNTVPFSNELVEDAVWSLFGALFQETQTQLYTPGGTRVPNDERNFRERDLYGFFQDQFKIKSNLTFNYGVRYEFDGVPWEAHNALTNASPAALAGPAPIQFTTVTRGGATPLYANDTKGVEPRIGLAWDPFKDGKTSVRLGYGISRDRQFFNITGNIRANPPLSLPFVNNAFLNLGPVPAIQISNNPVPTTQPAPPSNLPQFSFAFPQTVDPNFHVPYVQQWNFGIQRQLPWNLTFELNYVGNKANRLYRILDGNAPNNGQIASLRAFCADPTYAQRLQANPNNPGPNPNNAFGCIDNPIARVQDETVQSSNLYIGAELGLLPFDAVQNAAAFHANESNSVANSNNHSLQATLNRQFSHGMSFGANYTWAHAIDDASDGFRPQQGEFPFPANSGFLARERGNSSFDVRNRFVLNYVTELPLGRGKSHLTNGLVGRALEGWTWSGIATLQSGFPYEIFEGGVDSDGTGAQQRASFATSPTSIPFPTGLPVTGANRGLFTFPLFGGPGNVGRNVFRGPHYRNFDMVISKNTKLTERVSLQFRSEFYNIFNHPNFQQPDQFINDATFGESTAQVGRNDNTTGARQLQFGMKLLF